MVTGKGLAGTVREKFPRWVLVDFAFALFAANTINVGSDLAGMADAAEMLMGVIGITILVMFGAGVAMFVL